MEVGAPNGSIFHVRRGHSADFGLRRTKTYPARIITAVAWLAWGATAARAQNNLAVNPGFEAIGGEDFAAGWRAGTFGRIGRTVFLENTGAHAGRRKWPLP